MSLIPVQFCHSDSPCAQAYARNPFELSLAAPSVDLVQPGQITNRSADGNGFDVEYRANDLKLHEEPWAPALPKNLLKSKARKGLVAD
jgi:hypothetical protein